MDFTLSLSYQEQNDNKAIVLTDTSNVNDSDTNLEAGDALVVNEMYEIVTDGGNTTFTTSGSDSAVAGSRFFATVATALGAGDECTPVTPKATEISAGTLDVTVTNAAGAEDIKTQVNLYSEFATPPFGSQNEMVYTITAALLGDTADSLLVDGLYELDYSLTADGPNGGSIDFDLNVTILVYGQVKVATYEKLRNISTLYMCKDGAMKSDIAEADLCGAYLSSIENSAYIAKTEELLNMLTVLDNIIKNGSNITW